MDNALKEDEISEFKNLHLEQKKSSDITPSSPAGSTDQPSIEHNSFKAVTSHTPRLYMNRLLQMSLRSRDSDRKPIENVSHICAHYRRPFLKNETFLTRPAFLYCNIRSRRSYSAPTNLKRTLRTSSGKILLNRSRICSIPEDINEDIETKVLNDHPESLNCGLTDIESLVVAHHNSLSEVGGSVFTAAATPNEQVDADAIIQALGDESTWKNWTTCSAFSTPVYLQPANHIKLDNQTEYDESLVVVPTLFWGLPECTGERVAKWCIDFTFDPNRLVLHRVTLMGLLLRPAVCVRTSGYLKHVVEVEPESVIGLVRVENVAYEKQIFVRTSIDDWKTFTDYPAKFVPPENRQPFFSVMYDVFVFQIILPEEVNKLEFAIKYQWGNSDRGGVCWDNNDEKNYVLRKRSTSLNSPNQQDHMSAKTIEKVR